MRKLFLLSLIMILVPAAVFAEGKSLSVGVSMRIPPRLCLAEPIANQSSKNADYNSTSKSNIVLTQIVKKDNAQYMVKTMVEK